MARLIKDPSVYLVIENQLVKYKEKEGLFGYRGSLATYKTRPPVKWWGEYGDDTPELKAFAIKVLGLTCSASACERNWSTFNQVHTKRRNRLNTERLNNLVYIMYNKRLKQKFLKKTNLKEDEDSLVVDTVLSEDEWIVEPDDLGGSEASGEGGGGPCGEESGEDPPSTTRRGGGTIRGSDESSSCRKRKAVQMNLIDEEEEFVEEDDTDDDAEDDSDYEHDDRTYCV